MTENDKKIWETITEEDLNDIKSLGGGFKKCPSCKAPIEKNGGANYMRCPNCGKEFCWMCGKDWSSHNDHFTCPYYKPEEDPYLQK